VLVTVFFLALTAVVVGLVIGRPLRRLLTTAHALGAGDLSARVKLSGSDELGHLAQAFDRMADQVERLVRGRTELLASMAHELRTPLARVRASLDHATITGGEQLAAVSEEIAELESLITDVLTSARMDLVRDAASSALPPLRLAATDLGELVKRSVDRFGCNHPTRKVALDVEPDLPGVDADQVLLRRAVENLIENARKYSPPDSAIDLTVKKGDSGVALNVKDAGQGISPEDLEHIFDPFYRAPSGHTVPGHGLGLSLARRIAMAHGGTLTAVSAVGVGTTMILTIPRAPAT
jgi:signal transduction histidine kinase